MDSGEDRNSSTSVNTGSARLSTGFPDLAQRREISLVAVQMDLDILVLCPDHRPENKSSSQTRTLRECPIRRGTSIS